MLRRFFLGTLLITCCLNLFSQERSLDFYIQQAISNSPLLKDLTNQIRSNSLDSLIIKASRHPRVSFDGSVYYAPLFNGYGYSEAVTNGEVFSTLVNVSQEVFSNKTAALQYKKLDIQNLSIANAGKITAIELKKTITRQYLEVFFLFKEIESSQEILKSLEKEDSILRQFTVNGIYKQTEYLSFFLELQSQQLWLRETNTQYNREFSQLNLLCGISDGNVSRLLPPILVLKGEENPVNSPLFLRFRIDSLSILNEKLMLDRNYKPKVTWFTNAGILNNVPGDVYKNFGFALGVNLSIPVYDGDQRQLNYMKLKTSEETRRNYKEYFTWQYDVQLQQLKQELESTKSLVTDVEKQVATSGMLVKAYEELLSHGALPVTDYLVAIRNHILIRKKITDYQKRILQIITEINYWKQQ